MQFYGHNIPHCFIVITISLPDRHIYSKFEYMFPPKKNMQRSLYFKEILTKDHITTSAVNGCLQEQLYMSRHSGISATPRLRHMTDEYPV